MSRIGALCGLVYVAIVLADTMIDADALDPLAPLGLVLLVPYAAYVASVVRTAQRDQDWIPATVLGGGVAATAAVLGSGPGGLAQKATKGTQVHEVLHELSDIGFMLSLVPLGVMVAAVAVGALRTGALPRWVGWFSAVVGVVLIVNGSFPQSGFGPGFLLFLVWTAATSIVLLVRDVRASRPAPEPVTA